MIEKARFTQAIIKLRAIRVAELAYYTQSGAYLQFGWLRVPNKDSAGREDGWEPNTYPTELSPEISGDNYFTYACVLFDPPHALPPGATGAARHWAAGAYRRCYGPSPGAEGFGRMYLLMDLETGKIYKRYGDGGTELPVPY